MTSAKEADPTAVRPLSRELGARHQKQKHDFMGIGLSCLSDEAFLAAVREAIDTRSRLTVSFLNPYYALRAHRTSGLLDQMNRFDIMLPDGWGIVLGGRWLGLPVPNRQANDDICPKMFALSAEQGFSNFLFGGSEGTAERAAANMTARFPGLPIAGMLHGYWPSLDGDPGRYRDADIKLMAECINTSAADILYVCLSTPLQQNWVWQAADQLNVPVIITGGGYLDHLAERVDWYPAWVNKMRLGWAYRVYREPRRLWKRYSLDLMAYGGMLVREKLAKQQPGHSPPTSRSH